MEGRDVLDCYDIQQKRKLSEHLKIQENVFVSVHESLSLKQYVDVRQFICKQRHYQPCNDCLGMIDIAKRILNQGFIKLKAAMTISSPHVCNYKSSSARRKLLQMPLACIGVGKMEQGTYCMYVVEKQDRVNYSTQGKTCKQESS